jgi:hypothetical protein
MMDFTHPNMISASEIEFARVSRFGADSDRSAQVVNAAMRQFQISIWARRLVNYPPTSQETIVDLYARELAPGGSQDQIEHMRSELRSRITLAKLEKASEELKALAITWPRKRRRKASSHDNRSRRNMEHEKVRSEVREMHRAGLTQKEMVKRLAGRPRPAQATWAHLDWPIAFRSCRRAVSKWLSKTAHSV